MRVPAAARLFPMRCPYRRLRNLHHQMHESLSYRAHTGRKGIYMDFEAKMDIVQELMFALVQTKEWAHIEQEDPMICSRQCRVSYLLTSMRLYYTE